jgi:regulator of protease activity HflC (stomatin/prohibitin superfamily)
MEIIVIVIGAILAVPTVMFLLRGYALIRDDQVGIVTKKMGGKKLPEGRIIAREGEVAVQAYLLRPGLYWRLPIIWRIKKDRVTVVGPNQVGVVESVDGQPIPLGRLLGDEVECESFQDAKAFLDGGGTKGPQVAILRPGSYRINTAVFTVSLKPATVIAKEKIGVVVAQDGIPLPPSYIIAPKPPDEQSNDQPKVRPHRFFQDGQAFLDSNGYRGPQLDTLQPGEYYINPLLFKVEMYDVADVPPGYVAVLRSNVGKELEANQAVPASMTATRDFQQPVHEAIEPLLINQRDRRGILGEPVAPGKYNLNYIAYTPYMVPTSAVTIDWATSTQARMDQTLALPVEEPPVVGEKAAEFFRFSNLRVTSRDGFQLEVDVRMVIRIRPEHAPFVIARFGSVNNLIEQIVHPLVDSSFRNRAGEEKAIAFVQGRSELQAQALQRAREEFQHYFVEAQNLLIAYISVDKSLLDTQTKKEIATQQQEQYKEEAKAEMERISVQEQKARADKQVDVIAAKLSIAIAADRAESARREAEGIRDATRTKAEGEAQAVRQVGQATADAYAAQSQVVGPERLAVLKVLQEVSTGKVKITPDVLVNGGGDGAGGGLFSAWMATMLGPKLAPTGNEQATEDGKGKA